MGWWQRNPEVVSTELEDGGVLLNMATRTYYSLNESGLEIWRLVESVGNLDELTERLTRRFEVGTERARERAAAFLDGLARGGLVLGSDAQAAPPASLAAEEASAARRPFRDPELLEHDEPLHEIPLTPFDPQLPLAE